jgi:GTP cyclohydrolase IA
MNQALLKLEQELANARARLSTPAPVPAGGEAVAAAKLLLQAAREDQDREGLLRTPERFAKAFVHLCSGYHKTARDVVGEGVFAAEGKGLVAVRDVEFYSLCEHHMLPFWGKASVAYYPGESILGLSKIPRIVDLHARRLQVQERLTESIASDIVDLIAPRAVVVTVQAQHLCMMMRGVEKQGSSTTTETVRNSANISDEELRRLFAALGA